ncbi:hypothetical protein [Vibrio sp. WXL103]|uniref:hypothetical protein n=1 Tax=unclassified Vibrio TaxID=2614977 RepID=UPI003EC8059F
MKFNSITLTSLMIVALSAPAVFANTSDNDSGKRSGITFRLDWQDPAEKTGGGYYDQGEANRKH